VTSDEFKKRIGRRRRRPGPPARPRSTPPTSSARRASGTRSSRSSASSWSDTGLPGTNWNFRDCLGCAPRALRNSSRGITTDGQGSRHHQHHAGRDHRRCQKRHRRRAIDRRQRGGHRGGCSKHSGFGRDRRGIERGPGRAAAGRPGEEAQDSEAQSQGEEGGEEGSQAEGRGQRRPAKKKSAKKTMRRKKK